MLNILVQQPLSELLNWFLNREAAQNRGAFCVIKSWTTHEHSDHRGGLSWFQHPVLPEYGESP